MIIEEARAYACRACGSERLRKNGHARNGAQRAQCLECKKTRVLVPAPPPYSEAEKARIVTACTRERLSMRAATRLFGVAYETLRAWRGKKGRESARA